MNIIIKLSEYERMIKRCNDKVTIENDIKRFIKDKVEIETLLERAKEEFKNKIKGRE